VKLDTGVKLHEKHQPRSQALSSCGAKTLVGAGHVTHRKLIAQEGDGKVSYYMFPLHTSIARSGRSVQSSLRVICTSKYLLNWILFAFKLYKHAKLYILIATDKSGNQATKTYDCMLWNIACPFIFSGFGRAVSFHAYVSVLPLVQMFIIFL
jgi:hypothetical protein